MLNLVYTSSYGSSTKYYRSILEKLTSEGKKCFLFVPESSVLKTEQELFSSLCPTANLCFDVLSFKRLTNRLARQYGGLKNSFVSEEGKIILTALALKECLPLLTKYTTLAENEEFIKSLSEQITKLKSLVFTPEMLSDAASKARAAHLTVTADKLSDISVVYSAYDTLLHRDLWDMGDRLIYAATQLEDGDFFADSYVFFDGFSGFTPAEYAIIKKIMKSCKELYFTVFANEDEKSEVFEKPLATADTIKRLANKCSFPISLPTHLCEKNEKDDLELIRTSLWDSTVQDKASENVKIYACDGISGEAERAASIVLNLCREHGYQMKDIALCAVEPSLYEGILDAVFEKHNIPLFMSVKNNFSEFPLCKLVFASLCAVHNGFRCEDMMGVLKSALSNVPEKLADSLEIYARTWNISGGLWQTDKDFPFNPDGFSEKVSYRGEKILDDANTAKRLLAVPLYDLADKFKLGQCAKDYAVALYEYLNELKAEEKLDALADFDKEQGDIFLAELQKRLYESFVHILEECVELCGDKKLNSRQFEEILLLAMKSLSLQVIPTSIDEVQLLSPASLFGTKPKALIILGACEGIFPGKQSSDGFFTKAELRAFESLGLDLGADKEDFCCEPLREFYCAASLPTEKLFVLYDKKSPPSMAVHRLEKLFSASDITGKPLALVGIQAIADAYAESSDGLLAEILKSKAPKLYENTEKSIFFTEEKIDSEIAKKAIGENYSISPSTVESFRLCKLSCWCNRILSLRSEDKAELSVIDIGKYIHSILEKFINECLVSGKSFKDMTNGDISKCAEKGAEEFIHSVFGGFDDKSKRFKYIVTRLRISLEMFIRNMVEEFKQSKFVPWKTELPIGRGDVPGLCVTLEDGAKLSVNGITDRVDIYKKDDVAYIRVVDYKSGTKNFSLKYVDLGLDLQMLMYLFSVCMLDGDEEGRKLVPAGVLYSSPKKTSLAQNDLSAVMDDTIMREYAASGIFLADIDVLTAMDKELSGRFIPVKLKKDGSFYANSNVISSESFQKLQNQLEGILSDIGKEMREGLADAHPYNDGVRDACKYCKLQSLCRHEETLLEEE